MEVMIYMAHAKYVLRDGFRLVARHAGMSFLTIFTAMTVFFMIGASSLFLLNMNNIVRKMEGQVTISVYLKDKTNAKELADYIKKWKYVKQSKVITKNMALDRLRARIGSQANAVMLLGENPLPESIDVRVSSAEKVPEIARKLLCQNEVEDIIYPGRVAEKISKVSDFIKRFSLLLLIISIATSAIVLFNTIRISVYSRENEINVMLKVGATTTYVAMPFVIQGCILGMCGAILASGLIALTYYTAIGHLKEMLPFLVFIDSPVMTLKLSAVLILSGTALSLISSLFAVDGFIRKAIKPL